MKNYDVLMRISHFLMRKGDDRVKNGHGIMFIDITPHCNDDIKKIIEPAKPMINSSKWMVVHIKWPK